MRISISKVGCDCRQLKYVFFCFFLFQCVRPSTRHELSIDCPCAATAAATTLCITQNVNCSRTTKRGFGSREPALSCLKSRCSYSRGISRKNTAAKGANQKRSHCGETEKKRRWTKKKKKIFCHWTLWEKRYKIYKIAKERAVFGKQDKGGTVFCRPLHIRSD